MKKNLVNVILAVLILLVIMLLFIDKLKDNGLEGDPQGVNEAQESDGTIGSNETNDLSNGSSQNAESQVTGVESPQYISRAYAVKLLALLLESATSIRQRDREINFDDSSPEMWFDKYFNAAIIDGWLKAEEDYLNPMGNLTYGDLNDILPLLELGPESMPETMLDQPPDEPVSYGDFIAYYEILIMEEGLNLNRLLYIFATPASVSGLKPWEMATDKGIFSFEGLTLDAYQNRIVEAYVKDKEILFIKRVTEDNLLTNAYVKELKSEEMLVFMGGVERSYSLNPSLTIEPELEAPFIADLMIKGQEVISLTQKTNKIRGTVKKVTSEAIEIAEYGRLKLTDETKIY